MKPIMKPILIIQSHPSVPPGTIADFFADSDYPCQLVKLYQEQKLDSPDSYQAMIILGTPNRVDQIDQIKELRLLRDFAKEALAQELPALGICFGSQLLASLSGAKVKRNPVIEVGEYTVELTEAGLADSIFENCSAQEKVFHWHSDSFDLPDSANLLATTKTCTNQAFRLGNIVGLQFHPEVEESIVAHWCDEFKSDLQKREKTKEQVMADYQSLAGSLMKLSYTILKNFTKSLAQ